MTFTLWKYWRVVWNWQAMLRVYAVYVDGNAEGFVQSERPLEEVRAWIAASYRHTSITVDKVKLTLVYAPTRGELIELS